MSQVDESAFFAMLRRYVHDLNHGRLVHSTEFLALYFDTFHGADADGGQERLSIICKEWLEEPGIPEAMNEECLMRERQSPLMEQVREEADKWRKFNSGKRGRKGRNLPEIAFRKNLISEQKVQ